MVITSIYTFTDPLSTSTASLKPCASAHTLCPLTCPTGAWLAGCSYLLLAAHTQHSHTHTPSAPTLTGAPPQMVQFKICQQMYTQSLPSPCWRRCRFLLSTAVTHSSYHCGAPHWPHSCHIWFGGHTASNSVVGGRDLHLLQKLGPQPGALTAWSDSRGWYPDPPGLSPINWHWALVHAQEERVRLHGSEINSKKLTVRQDRLQWSGTSLSHTSMLSVCTL